MPTWPFGAFFISSAMTFDYSNILLALLTIANGWILVAINSSRRTIENLKAADSTMSEKIAGIQLLIAGSYLTRDEFRNAMQQQTASIVKAIEKLDEKVERKVDK
jgi:hypothetical protein